MAAKSRGKTKHALIFDYVHSAILSGRFDVGQRVPSEVQLCRRFNATRVTVGKAMSELEHAGFIERRPGSGSYVRLHHENRSKFLGLLVPSLGEGEIFEPICSAIATSVRAHQFTILWGQGGSSDAVDKNVQAEQLCKRYIDQKVDGVFFSPIELTQGMEEVNRRITAMLDRAGIPVVLLDCDILKFPRRSRHDVVCIDNRRVGYALAEHLIEQGCRHIEFVFRSLSAQTIDARIAGYREALLEHGIAPQPEWVRCGEVADMDYVRQLVAEKRPDAFICGNDYTAAYLMQNLAGLGIRVPEDVCVTGVDDLKYAKLLGTPLTTVHQPCATLGEAAVEAMVARIENPTMPARDIVVDFHLVVRKSSSRKAETAAKKE
jgi:DNA-binding LacI/PurR family transcriptional regulator